MTFYTHLRSKVYILEVSVIFLIFPMFSCKHMFFTSLRIVQNWLFLTPQSSLGWSPLDVFPPINGHIVLCIHKLRSLGLNPRCCKCCLCGPCLLLPYSSNEHFFFFLFLPTVGVVRPHLPALLLGRQIKSQSRSLSLLNCLVSALHTDGLGTARDVKGCTQHLAHSLPPGFRNLLSHFPATFPAIFSGSSSQEDGRLAGGVRMPWVTQARILLRLKAGKTGNKPSTVIFPNFNPSPESYLLLVSLTHL